jgi:hypothetical protein
MTTVDSLIKDRTAASVLASLAHKDQLLGRLFHEADARGKLA